MKKLIMLPLLFTISIPVHAQDKALFIGDFSPEVYIEFARIDASLPANNPLYARERDNLKVGQILQLSTFSQLPNRPYLLKVTDFDSIEQKSEKPHLGLGRILGKVLVGGIGTWAGGIVLGMNFESIANDRTQVGDEGVHSHNVAKKV